MINSKLSFANRLFVMAICLNFANFVRTETCFNATQYVVEGKRLAGSGFWSAKAQDLEQCMVLCVRQKRCTSINFNLKTNLCQLNKGTNAEKKFVSKKYFVYSEFNSWPAEVDKHCFSRPCKHNEVCVPGSLSSTFMSASTCPYSCMSFNRPVCPLPKKGVSNGRTVGSVNVVKCQDGMIGVNATCLPTREWDKKAECVEIHNHECSNDTVCSKIGAICQEGKCQCPSVYNTTNFRCYTDCEPPPEVEGAKLVKISDVVQQYECKENLRPKPGTNATIVCNEDSKWEDDGFQCYGLRLTNGSAIVMSRDIEIDTSEYGVSGFLQMFKGGQWRGVCLKNWADWNWNKTSVACRELHQDLKYGGMFHKNWRFGESPEPNLPEKNVELSCEGTEDSLYDCAEKDCKNQDVVALTCFKKNRSEMFPFNAVTLSGAMPTADPTQAGLPGLLDRELLLWVFMSGKWGYVAKETNDESFNVACRSLNSNWTFNNKKDEKIEDDNEYRHRFHCTGSEPHLFYCEHEECKRLCNGGECDGRCKGGEWEKAVKIKCSDSSGK